MWRKERHRHLKGSLHKAAIKVLVEEIEVGEKQRKQLYIDADLEKLISKKKKLYLKAVATKSQEDRNEYNILKRNT
jgi:hypothetical protein